METTRYKGDTLAAVYMKDEIAGLGVHLVQR